MKLQIAYLALVLVSLIGHARLEDVPKPSYARTMLKVSRSLPGETEEVRVRTSEGNLATLIVKRREKSGPEHNATKTAEVSTKNHSEHQQNVRSNSSSVEREREANITYETIEHSRKKEEVQKSEERQVEEIRAKVSSADKTEALRKDRSSSNKNLDAGGTFRKDVTVDRAIDYGRWTPLSKDGRALVVEPISDEYQNWRPLPVNPEVTASSERASYARYYPGNLVIARNLDTNAEREKSYATFPHQPRPLTRTNIGANLSKNRDAKNVPAEVVVRSEINVKPVPKRAGLSLDVDGTPIIEGKRVPDEPIDKFQTWRNARVIDNKLVSDGTSSVVLEASPLSSTVFSDSQAEKQRFERFFKDLNKRYGRNYDEEGRNVYFEWDPKNYKSEALKAEVYESRADNYRPGIHKRMLQQHESVPTYPTSQLYTPEVQKIAPLALKPGARAPVLQYAHPELGVQPAKILKNEKRRPDNFPESQHSFTEQRQKKKYVLNDKSIIDNYNTKNYYPNQHFYGLRRPSEAPFWVKISENLKNQISTGVEKVSQFTRPVFDPLVEATHKISQNLGLSRAKEAQDKIGSVVSGTSMLIPALGLVASGAALGIGAVAVGRYLDVDVLKRSNENSDKDFDGARLMTNPENLYILDESLKPEVPKTTPENGILLLVENPKDVGNERTEGRRSRRSLDYLDVLKAEAETTNLIRNKRFQRKGADSISEIVEIDLPVRGGSIDVTEFFVPKSKNNVKPSPMDDGTILVVEDRVPVKEEVKESPSGQNSVESIEKLMDNVLGNGNMAKKNEDTFELVYDNDEQQTKKSNVRSRRRRSTDSDQELEDAFQNLENAEVTDIAHIDGDWTNTPCAKRIFCDTMIQRGPEASIFMEKKMAALLGLIQPGAAVQVSSHFAEVMEAVRRHDCSSFLCPQARPGNVFF
ncbi:uncharacterized protein [Prorops nasuta]|uniref:uncharacterized protein n=1 Tax=Prorops nasuta TaxID=863751 RepID=UPI0034CDC440